MKDSVLVPLIVASAIFMQQMDSTALATSLPVISAALGETPVRAHIVLTAYLFSLAAFVPVSGWLSDQLGPRLVFRAAILIFTASSLVCGFADNLTTMVIARIFQGLGGAMMSPVARLILVRSVEKSELVRALALMSMPAMLGPIAGPLVGGVLTTYASWRWIFWVNVPIGILGVVLVTLFVQESKEPHKRRFDPVGVALLGVGLSSLLLGIDSDASDASATAFSILSIAFGAGCLWFYVRHAARNREPILDLSLLRVATFRASIAGGSLFRIGTGAMPFLVPLFFQSQFGFTPVEAGLVTVVSAIGALGMRTVSSWVLLRFGFRSVLVWNALVAAGFMAACAVLQPATPLAVSLLILFLGGIFRSLELASINALAFADLHPAQMSHATTMSTMAQRLSQSMGIAIAAFSLQLVPGTDGLSHTAFVVAFSLIASLAGLSCIEFLWLDRNAGSELTGRSAAGGQGTESD